MSKKKKLRCYECNEKLTESEIESQYLTPQGELLCEICYDEEYAPVSCSMCEEDEEPQYFGDIGTVLVCVDADGTGLSSIGVYEITDHPYYADGMITMTMFESSLKLLTTNLYGLEDKTDGYPIDHLCRSCSHRIKSDLLHNSLGRPVDIDNNCLYCDEPLSQKELELPHRDDDGDLICSRCWRATKDDHGQGEAVPS